MLKEFLDRVIEGESLEEEEAFRIMGHIMEGGGPPAQIASLLTALRMKGETIPEITGFARAMRQKAVPVSVPEGACVADTCGTGGDGAGTFNISTAVALVAAGAGLTVAKHGNRSVSSRCGSADVLEALGVNLLLSPEAAGRALREIGLAFLFAPSFHPAMKNAAGLRREMGIRTVFNLLGPLTNPAGARVHLIGVYRADLTRPVAEVLKNLGSTAALVVHGEGRLDEVSLAGKTVVSRLAGGVVRDDEIEPEGAGIRRGRLAEIQGGSPEENARILLRILEGEAGPPRDAVLLNAAALFLGAGKAGSLREGASLARESIDSGAAGRKLGDLIRFSREGG